MAYKKSTAPEYYKVRTHEGSKNLTITKFDQELDAISTYVMTFYEARGSDGYYDCSCPAAKFDCRHKGIMKQIMDVGQADSEKFFCHQAPADHPENVGKFLLATEV